jgi:hypothetical protein
MMDREALIEAVSARLVAGRVEVARVADTLNVKFGVGLVAHKANIDPSTLLERLAGEPEQGHARLIAGFVSGVKAVLGEPINSKAASWEFRQAAARLMPGIEVDTFVLGAQAAGEDPWVIELGEGLVQAFFLELDRGSRVVSRAQVAGWGTTRDRMEVAARSMLFHKTREIAQREPVSEHPGVWKIRVGDGWDASRGVVIPDMYFSEIDEPRYRFATPHQDLVLYTQEDGTGAPSAALALAAEAAYAEAAYPLTARIFSLKDHMPVLAHLN